MNFITRRSLNTYLRVWLRCSLALLVTSGCGSREEKMLIGSWKVSGFMASGTMTYSKDHTWVMSITGLVGGSESGSWKLAGDKLTSKTLTSTLNKNGIGMTEVFQIVKVDDTVLILKKEGGQGADVMVTFSRVK